MDAAAIAAFLSPGKIKTICPAADPDIIEAIITEAPAEFPAAGLTTPVAMAHFFSQIATETGGLGRLDENLNYSTPARLIAVFGKKRFPTPAFAAGFVNSPKKLANFVYGGRLGNTLPDDGFTYRGSGLIQLTGRENFRKVGKLVGMSLEDDPDLCRIADSALKIALGYWRLNKISDIAVDDTEASLVAVTKRINPAKVGLDDRRIFLKRAVAALKPPPVPAAAPAMAAMPMAKGKKKLAMAAPAAAATAVAATAAPLPSLSGAHWVAFFPTSKSLNDLADAFRDKAKNFVAALEAAGAAVTVSATKRPQERADLMHFSWRIAKDGLAPAAVPKIPGVPIDWVHPTPTASKQAAKDMVAAYGISSGLTVPPSRKSRHIDGLAIDMTISWSGNLTIRKADGTSKTIMSAPRNGSNSDLIAVGADYGAIKLMNDPPHWSSDGK
jgi:predicted chitinase